MGYIGSGPTRFNTADELTVTGDAEFNGNLTVKGTTTTIDSASVQTVDLGDNDKIRLGDGDDLQIYHDGSNSIINDAGTGSLKFQYGGTDGVVFDSSGNVGIGVTSISTQGQLYIGASGTSTNAQIGLSPTNSGGGQNPLSQIGASADGTYGSTLYFNTRTTGGTVSERMRIDSSGRVGIGVTPSAWGSAWVPAQVGVGSTIVGRTTDYTNTNIVSNAYFDGTNWKYLSSNIASKYYQLSGNHVWDTAASGTAGNNITFSEAMRIDSSGRVGIGTTSPTSGRQLTLRGNDAGLQITGSAVGANAYLTSTPGSSANFYFGTTSAKPIIFVTNGATTERMRIDSSGNVGIGTSSPSYKTEISDGTVTFGVNPLSAYSTVYVGTTTNHGMNFITNGNSRLNITSSGNVGIGTGSPLTTLDIQADSGTNIPLIVRGGSSQTNAFIAIRDTNTTGDLYNRIGSVGDNLVLYTNQTERLRIDSSGNVAINTTSPNTSYQTTIQSNSTKGALSIDGPATNGYYAAEVDMPSGNSYGVLFKHGGTGVGSIGIGASSTSYNTSSDYRLKENVVADWDATTRLKQLNPVRFNFIADPDTTVDGFLAHEVQSVVPEAISGTHNGMRDEEYQVSAATGEIYTPAIDAVLDEDGNEVTPAVAEVIHSTDVERPEELAEGQQWRETTPAVMGTRSVPDYQGIDQSKLVPLLVKTIQELEARITALENV